MAKKNKHGKVGRPPLRRQRADYVLSVRLTQHEAQILRDFVFRYDTCASDVVRDALAVLGVIPDFHPNL